MDLTSLAFIIFFFPISFFVYHCVLRKASQNAKKIWLIFISLGFYAWGEPVFVVLLAVSIILNFYIGSLIIKIKSLRTKKYLAGIGITANLLLLFFFKYLNYSLSLIFGIFTNDIPFLSIVLPLGISFYTFSAISYLVDIYRKGSEINNSFINVLLYMSFFPKMTMGPIVKYQEFIQSIPLTKVSFDDICDGVWRFVKGLGKKVLIANNIAHITQKLFEIPNTELTIIFSWYGMLAYMLQLYFDFSGYSDMAIGLSKIFGFKIRENFNYPYTSKSIAEYWRRWHISLGEWFRDYVYYPLTLGPAIKVRKYFSGINKNLAKFAQSFYTLLIIWMATGIWHGANLTFIIWGLLQFVIILAEQYRKPIKNKILENIFSFSYTFFIVYISKVLFSADSLSSSADYFKSMIGFHGNAFIDDTSIFYIREYAVYVITGCFLSFPIFHKLNDFLVNKSIVLTRTVSFIKLVSMIGIFFLSIAFLIQGISNPFLYENF